MITDLTPFYPSAVPSSLSVAVDRLIQIDAQLSGAVNAITQRSIVFLVESMNCYYSNLIEGHKTLPIEIEQAVSRQSDNNGLILGHILAQRLARSSFKEPLDQLVRQIHQKVYETAGEKDRLLENGVLLTPGEYRTLDVKVGHHIPPLNCDVGSYIQKLTREYDRKPSWSISRSVISAFCSHHRFVWVHPFADGNGRAARILLDAMLMNAGLKGIGLWSMSRGYARNESRYKVLLAQADLPRQGSMDGRGNLSEKALIDFVSESISMAIDQVQFMQNLFDFNSADARFRHYFTNVRLDLGLNAYKMYRQVFLEGEIDRGSLTSMLDVSDRTARNTLKMLLGEGLFLSDSPKGAVRCGFPVSSLAYFFPNLFPPKDLEFAPIVQNIRDEFSLEIAPTPDIVLSVILEHTATSSEFASIIGSFREQDLETLKQLINERYNQLWEKKQTVGWSDQEEEDHGNLCEAYHTVDALMQKQHLKHN